MFALFLVLTIAVVAVMLTRWESVQGWSKRLSGLLSIALGVRAVALATTFYVLPGLAIPAFGDEEKAPPAAEQAAADETNTAAEAVAPAETSETADGEAPVPAVSSEATTTTTNATDATTPESAKPASDTAEPNTAQQQTAPSATAEQSSPAEKTDVPADNSQSATLKSASQSLEVPAEVEPSKPATADELVERQLARAAAREPIKFVTRIEYLTPNRPQWLETPPSYDGNSYLVSVKAGPYPTVRDCEPDLEKEVSAAVSEYINDRLDAKHASTFIRYSLDDLRHRHVVREQFAEQLGTSYGLMHQVHAKLVFDDAFRTDVEKRWSEITAKSRLAQTGLGAGVLLLLLSTVFSYFKLDTATKGYYTGRLQFATAGTILALVAASMVLAKWIPWM